jgi:hypothetical protein
VEVRLPDGWTPPVAPEAPAERPQDPPNAKAFDEAQAGPPWTESPTNGLWPAQPAGGPSPADLAAVQAAQAQAAQQAAQGGPAAAPLAQGSPAPATTGGLEDNAVMAAMASLLGK